MRARTLSLLALGILCGTVHAADPPPSRGIPQQPDFFPLAVWLQSPSNAARYRDVGINLYVGLWKGPTAEHLDALDAAGIRLIPGQSPSALKFKDRPTIVGWLQDDEPDNAQALRRGEGYGPPKPPPSIIDRYRELKRADPDRPVLLNLGQGVAWDGWYGRGVRTNHSEDYPEYLKGCDIASFDIYPSSHTHQDVAGKLQYVPAGVDRLRRWTEGRKPVWCCIETTGIDNPKRRPTPREVRSEVWMALIHGARGLIYFSHQFKPTFIEAGLLADDAMAREIASINRQIRELAPVLNSPDVPDGATVVTANEHVPVDFAVKCHADATYLFSVAMRDGETTATFKLPDQRAARVEVLGEGRTIEAPGGQWSDEFAGFQPHLYRITPQP